MLPSSGGLKLLLPHGPSGVRKTAASTAATLGRIHKVSDSLLWRKSVQRGLKHLCFFHLGLAARIITSKNTSIDANGISRIVLHRGRLQDQAGIVFVPLPLFPGV